MSLSIVFSVLGWRQGEYRSLMLPEPSGKRHFPDATQPEGSKESGRDALKSPLRQQHSSLCSGNHARWMSVSTNPRKGLAGSATPGLPATKHPCIL